MKKFSIVFGICFFICGMIEIADAQMRAGYVNSDRILVEFEEAKEAQSKLDVEAKKIERRYSDMLAKLDSLSQEYDRQKLIMSEARRKDKEMENWLDFYLPYFDDEREARGFVEDCERQSPPNNTATILMHQTQRLVSLANDIVREKNRVTATPCI